MIAQQLLLLFTLSIFFETCFSTAIVYDQSYQNTEVLVINPQAFAACDLNNIAYGLRVYSLSNPSDVQNYSIDSTCQNLVSVDYSRGIFLMLTQANLYFLEASQNPLSFSKKYSFSKQVTSLNYAEKTKNDNNIVGLCSDSITIWDNTQCSQNANSQVSQKLITLKSGFTGHFLFSFGQGASRRIMVGFNSANQIQFYQIISNALSLDNSIPQINYSMGYSNFKQIGNLVYWRTLTKLIIYRFNSGLNTSENFTLTAKCSPTRASLVIDTLEFIVNCNDSSVGGGVNQYNIQKINFSSILCDPFCIQCSSTLVTQCQSCQASLNFINDSGKCVCISNYYLDASKGECFRCPIQCNGCQILSGQIECLSCSSSNSSSDHRQTLDQSKLCSCQERYYDNGNLLCKPCDATCLTCTDNQKTSCTSCDLNNDHRQLNVPNKTCDCVTNYKESSPPSQQCVQCSNNQYFDTTDSTCKNCPIQCNGCQILNGQLECLACSTISPSYHRQTFDQNKLCSCQERYYDDGSLPCKPCDASCLTCTDNQKTSCLSCDLTNDFRQLNIPNKTCDCQNNYQESNPQSQQCVQCSSNQYFDPTSHTCKNCPIQCNGCQISNGQLECLACFVAISPSYHRKDFSQNKLCACQERYYDDGNLVCKPCDITCLTCTDNQKISCLSCDSLSDHRQLDLPNKTCVCQINYQENSPQTQQCIQCTNSQYYDQSSKACKNCPIQCKGCSISNGQLQCTACNSNINQSQKRQTITQNSLCSCQERYYDDGNLTCKPCDKTCLTCLDSNSTSCQSCDSSNDNRKFNNANKTCDCLMYFTENNPRTQACVVCHPTCLTCSGILVDQCLSCDSNKNRQLDGVNKCKCKDGFYDDGTFNCVQCHFTCLTCNGSSENDCLSCNPANNRYIYSNKCLCNPGYTENLPITSSCQECHYSCQTCFGPNSNQCNTCDYSKKRKIQNQNCVCDSGYYEKGISLCDSCNLTCETCIGGNALNNCLSCSQSQFRHIQNSYCICNQGYVEYSPIQQNCQCDINQNRRLNSFGQCVCQDGYYEDSSKNCLKCHYSCKTCFGGQINQCITCESSHQRILNDKVCSCSDNYFDNGISQCQKCINPKCKNCDKDTQECLGCFDSQNRYLDNQGICSCKRGYIDDQGEFDNKCFIKCIENCETCMPEHIQSCIKCKEYYSFNQRKSKCTRNMIPTAIPGSKIKEVSDSSEISAYISIAVSTTSSVTLSFVSYNNGMFKVLFTLQKINFFLLINFPFPQILYEFQKQISGKTPLKLLNQINLFPKFLNENEEQYSGQLQDSKFKLEQIKTSIICNAGGLIPVLLVYLLLLLASYIVYKRQRQKDQEIQNIYKGLILPINLYVEQRKQNIIVKLLNKLIGILTLQMHELISTVFVFSITLQILSYSYNAIDSSLSILFIKAILFCFILVYSIGAFLYYANFINKFYVQKQNEEISSYSHLLEMNVGVLINPTLKKQLQKIEAESDLRLPEIVFQNYIQDYIKPLFLTRNFLFINDAVELIIIPLCIIAPFENSLIQIILCLTFQSLLCIFVLVRRPSKLNLNNLELFLINFVWVIIFVCYLILAYLIEYNFDLDNLDSKDTQKLDILSLLIMVLCLVQIFIIPFFLIAGLIKQIPMIVKKIRQKIKKEDQSHDEILLFKQQSSDIQFNQNKNMLESISFYKPQKTLNKSLIQMNSFKQKDIKNQIKGQIQKINDLENEKPKYVIKRFKTKLNN